MDATRLYTLGDLVQDLHDHYFEVWIQDVGSSATRRATTERKLDRIEMQLQYTLTGTAWVYVYVVGKRAAWSRDYAIKCWVRKGDRFEIHPMCID